MGSYGMKFTGQMLIDACTGEPPKYPFGNCVGVIAYQISWMRESDQVTFCKPDSILKAPVTAEQSPFMQEYKQSYEIVMKYMEDNPKERHKQLVYIVRAALEEAFPCDD